MEKTKETIEKKEKEGEKEIVVPVRFAGLSSNVSEPLKGLKGSNEVSDRGKMRSRDGPL